MFARSLVVLVCSVCMLLFGAAPALAQGDGSPAEDAQARAVFEGFAKRNATIERRRERAESSMAIDSDIPMLSMMAGRKNREWEYSFAAPNRFRVDMEGIELACDGAQLWAAQPALGRFAQRSAPAQGAMVAAIDEIMGKWGSAPPSLALLLSGSGRGLDLYGDSQIVITGHAADEVGGVACVRFDLAIVMEQNPMNNQALKDGDSVSMTGAVWFGMEAGTMVAIEVEMAEMWRRMFQEIAENEQMAGMMGLATGKLDEDSVRSAVMRIEIATLPEDSIDDAMFQIPDSDGLERVEFFEEYMPEDYAALREPLDGELTPRDFIGEEAPEFAGVDQHGRRVALGDHRGEVVLLLVWPLYTGERADPWLDDLDALLPAFEGMPVAAMAQMSESVSMFGNESKIDFTEYSLPIVGDRFPRQGDRFRVTRRPALFVIDPAGVVQAVHESREEANAELLIDEVARLLDGERIYDEVAVKARRDEVRAVRAAQEAEAPTVLTVEYKPDRSRSRNLARSAMGSYSIMGGVPVRLIDLDRDGVDDVATCLGSRIVVVDGASKDSESIDLEGVEGRNTTITAFDRIRTSRGDCWVVAITQRSGFSNQTTDWVGAFDDSGAKLWMRTLRAPEGLGLYMPRMADTFSVGDLDEDGLDEVVLGITTHGDDFDTGSSLLIVLDSEGGLRHAKKMPMGLNTVRVIPGQQGRRPWIALEDSSGLRLVEVRLDR